MKNLSEYLIKYENLKTILINKDFAFFTNEMSLNIVGIRCANRESNSFDDLLTVSFVQYGQPITLVFPCTTDPGLHYRERPMNINGTAIVVPGQYRGLWRLGKHQNRYTALVQNKPVNVYRDDNKDQILDFEQAAMRHGMFGINLHRANSEHASIQVDKWSAGCQVLADPFQFDLLMSLCQLSSNMYGNSFTYTLLEESDL